MLVGLGAGAVIGGGVCTGLASSQYDDYKKTPWDDPAKKNTMWDEIQTKNIASYALYGAGAAMIAGGLIWYFVADAKAVKQAKARYDLEFNPMLGGVYGGSMSIGW